MVGKRLIGTLKDLTEQIHRGRNFVHMRLIVCIRGIDTLARLLFVDFLKSVAYAPIALFKTIIQLDKRHILASMKRLVFTALQCIEAFVITVIGFLYPGILQNIDLRIAQQTYSQEENFYPNLFQELSNQEEKPLPFSQKKFLPTSLHNCTKQVFTSLHALTQNLSKEETIQILQQLSTYSGEEIEQTLPLMQTLEKNNSPKLLHKLFSLDKDLLKTFTQALSSVSNEAAVNMVSFIEKIDIANDGLPNLIEAISKNKAFFYDKKLLLTNRLIAFLHNKIDQEGFEKGQTLLSIFTKCTWIDVQHFDQVCQWIEYTQDEDIYHQLPALLSSLKNEQVFTSLYALTQNLSKEETIQILQQLSTYSAEEIEQAFPLIQALEKNNSPKLLHKLFSLDKDLLKTFTQALFSVPNQAVPTLLINFLHKKIDQEGFEKAQTLLSIFTKCTWIDVQHFDQVCQWIEHIQDKDTYQQLPALLSSLKNESETENALETPLHLFKINLSTWASILQLAQEKDAKCLQTIFRIILTKLDENNYVHTIPEIDNASRRGDHMAIVAKIGESFSVAGDQKEFGQQIIDYMQTIPLATAQLLAFLLESFNSLQTNNKISKKPDPENFLSFIKLVALYGQHLIDAVQSVETEQKKLALTNFLQTIDPESSGKMTSLDRFITESKSSLSQKTRYILKQALDIGSFISTRFYSKKDFLTKRILAFYTPLAQKGWLSNRLVQEPFLEGYKYVKKATDHKEQSEQIFEIDQYVAFSTAFFEFVFSHATLVDLKRINRFEKIYTMKDLSFEGKKKIIDKTNRHIKKEDFSSDSAEKKKEELEKSLKQILQNDSEEIRHIIEICSDVIQKGNFLDQFDD